jgi:CBS domain containing-hemolysin-like protein
MTWKDIVILSIPILGFIVIILSIILNDKTPMDIFQSIYLIVLLSIIPAQRVFYWLKKVSNRKKSV